MAQMLRLWQSFKLAELTEVMRQRGDTVFIDLLNNVRIGKLTESDSSILKSRFINENDPHYPHHALHLFAENAPVIAHNERKLNDIDHPLFTINAIDEILRYTPISLVTDALNRKQNETGGVARVLKLKVNAKIMITANIDIDDRLINGQIGTVYKIIAPPPHNKVTKIYVQFQDPMAGLNKKSKDLYGEIHNAVPIERIRNRHTCSQKYFFFSSSKKNTVSTYAFLDMYRSQSAGFITQ